MIVYDLAERDMMTCPHCDEEIQVIHATWHYKLECRVLNKKLYEGTDND